MLFFPWHFFPSFQEKASYSDMLIYANNMRIYFGFFRLRFSLVEWHFYVVIFSTEYLNYFTQYCNYRISLIHATKVQIAYFKVKIIFNKFLCKKIKYFYEYLMCKNWYQCIQSYFSLQLTRVKFLKLLQNVFPVILICKKWNCRLKILSIISNELKI